ncbi:MAG TPA: hypothetical protein VH661_06850 [Candidatus Dormibacteraeota bacterium]|jgi:hypothetical protein|nr:hypothetical protein [Candidatus Dormibacteraeota bacterium]
MDPVDYREERVSTGTASAATPVATPAPATAPGVATVRPAAGPYIPTPAPTTTTRTYASRAPTSGSSRLAQFVWLVVGVVDAILALDFIFRAAGGANTGFAHYVYRIGGWLSAPFAGIFTNTPITNGRTFVRWADVLAVLIYTLAALAVVKLVQIVAPPRVRTPV